MRFKRALSFSIVFASVGIPLLVAFTNCSQTGFEVFQKSDGESSAASSDFLANRTYDSSFGDYSSLFLKDQIDRAQAQQKLRAEQSAETLDCEIVGDFNLKTHFKIGVGPKAGESDTDVYDNTQMHQQYSNRNPYVPLYSNRTISLNSYIGNRYDPDTAVSSDQAKYVTSLLCGNRVKKVNFILANNVMTSSADILNNLIENASYHQIIHGIVFRNNLFTIVIPPFWSAQTKYPVLVNGFYGLNYNVFHPLGEGQKFFQLQRRLIDDGQRGFIGVMWNGGGAVASRTMNDLAYTDFNDFIGAISNDLGMDTNKGVSFGISRGGITALNLAAHPAVKNLKFAFVNAASPAIDAGYIGDLITPTIPALLYANDWSTGYLGSWRNSFKMQSGNSGLSQHLTNLVGTDNKSTITNQYSIISPARINKLKANQTAVYMELSSHDIIVPFADQLRGLNKLIEQQVKIEGRINYLVGHQEDDTAMLERIYRVLLALNRNQPVPSAPSGTVERKVLVENANRNKIFSNIALTYGGVPLTIEVPRLIVPDANFQVIVTGTPGRRYILTAQDNGADIPKTLDFTVDPSGISIINLPYSDISGSETFIDEIYEVNSQGVAQFKLQTRSSVAGSDQKLKISKLQSSYTSTPHFHGVVINKYLGDNCKNCLLNGEFNSYGLLEVQRTPASEADKLKLQSYLNARCSQNESYENGTCKETAAIPPEKLDPATAKCASGSTTVSSADGKSSCSFSWTEATVGAASRATVLSGNLSVNGTCQLVNNNLTWKWNYNCLSSSQVSCHGGQHISKSPSGATTCTFPFSSKLAGETQTVPASTGSGQATGVCLSDGRWQYTASCNDPKTVSCPSGEQPVGKKCWFIWKSAAPGENHIVMDQNGTGSTYSGSCGSDGVWKNVRVPTNRCD